VSYGLGAPPAESAEPEVSGMPAAAYSGASAVAPAPPVPAVSRPRVVEPKPAPRPRSIIAVGGGKGGIGKSMITSSLGICLARRGRKVVLIDADLGGANLHTALGLSTPKLTLGDFINRRVSSINEVIIDSGVSNLGLISGAHDYLTASNLKYFQKTRLLNRIRDIDADFIFLDIGAGISFNIVDFFLLAEAGLLVVVPEPSSIENAYRFLKMSFYRHLWSAVKGSRVRRCIEKAMDEKNREGIRTPFDLLETVERMDEEAGQALKARAQAFHPRLIINQIRYPEDERLGPSMASVCRKHLGVDIDCLGAVHYDDVVWQANRRKKPFMLVYPDSQAGQSLDRAAVTLLSSAKK
jgi:flagellar biosynthesis protein FlhG